MFKTGNGRGLFASPLLFRGSQPWDLCLVSASSFQSSWIIFKNRGRKQVSTLHYKNVNNRILGLLRSENVPREKQRKASIIRGMEIVVIIL